MTCVFETISQNIDTFYREIMGANSGSLVTRTFIFYEQREDMSVNLRLHPLTSEITDLLNIGNFIEYTSYKVKHFVNCN